MFPCQGKYLKNWLSQLHRHEIYNMCPQATQCVILAPLPLQALLLYGREYFRFRFVNRVSCTYR